MKRILVTVTGPSASGKTELVHRLIDGHGFGKLVSVTTRPMRVGEVEGKDYYFISESDFNDHEATNGLIQSVNFNGKNYGTTIDGLERVFEAGLTPIVIVEPGGVNQFESLEDKHDFVVYSVFITAPYEVLEQRFKSRIGSELSEYDQRRLDAIKVESETWHDTHIWDTVFHNGGNDKSSIDWMCKLLTEHVNNKSMEENVW